MLVMLAFATSIAIVAPAHAQDHWIVENSTDISSPYIQKVQSTSNISELAQIATTEDLKAYIHKQMKAYNTTIQLQYIGDTSNIKNEIEQINNELQREDDYVYATLASTKYGYEGFENNITITYTMSYHTNASQEAFVQSEVKRIVADIIRPSMTQVEKVKAINDYIVLNTTYTFDASTSVHTPYTILHEGKGVCQAYAALAYLMLKEAGFDVRYVTGNVGEDHAWNLVKVDGAWYHLDTTWNDPVFKNPDSDMSHYVQYKYFLLSDKEIQQDHVIDPYDYPKATSDRFIALRDIETPVDVNGVLYYPNNKDNEKLYKLNINASIPQAQKVSDTRVQLLTYANTMFYFSNYSAGAYLYKMNIDGSNKILLVEQPITSIDIQNGKLYAYNGHELVYSEPIADQGVTALEEAIFDLNRQFLSPQFAQAAQNILAMKNSLTNSQLNLLSQAAITQLNEIETKYAQMTNLTFDSTTKWAETTQISNPQKQWTITLSQPVKDIAANTKKIEIVNMFGERVSTTVDISDTKIIITPLTNYVKGIPYTLIIQAGLENINNQQLQRGTHLQFILTE